MKGFLATLFGASGDPAGAGRPPPDDDIWYGGSLYGNPMSFAGRRVTPDLSMRVSAVYACVNLLSRTVASLPLSIYRRQIASDGTVSHFEAPSHPLNDLLSYQPNTWQTAWDFRAMMMTHLCLRGNAYAQIFPGPRGAVDRLEPIHPDRVVVERVSDGSLVYRVSGALNDSSVMKSATLTQDEVFHVRSSIAPGLIGLSPIAYARETIGLAMAAEEHGARMFTNGARPSGALVLPKDMKLKPGEFDRLRAEFNASFSGLANVGKTPILEGGAEFKPIGMTADEIQFLGTRQFQLEEICRWFDVPPVMLHHDSKNTPNGSGIETIMLNFVRNNLMPWLEAWQQAIRRDLIIAPGRYEARFDVEGLQRGDSTALSNYLSRLVLNGVMTRNEAREVIGYNALDGLDEPLTPSNTHTNDGQPGNGNDPAQEPTQQGDAPSPGQNSPQGS